MCSPSYNLVLVSLSFGGLGMAIVGFISWSIRWPKLYPAWYPLSAVRNLGLSQGWSCRAASRVRPEPRTFLQVGRPHASVQGQAVVGVADDVGVAAEKQVLLAFFSFGALVLGGAVPPSGVRVRRDLAVGVGVGWNISGVYGQDFSQC